jgi:hypothetical protein
MPQHGVLDDEFPSASNNVGRHTARDARPAAGATAFQMAAALDRTQSTM